jgi:hypothetical protein
LLNKDLLPAGLNTTDKVQKAAESGALDNLGMATVRVVEAGDLTGDESYLIANLSVYAPNPGTTITVENDKIITATQAKPYTLTYLTSPLRTFGVGTTKSQTSYFGTRMLAVLIVKFDYEVPNSDPSGVLLRGKTVVKAAVQNWSSNGTTFQDLHTPVTGSSGKDSQSKVFIGV